MASEKKVVLFISPLPPPAGGIATWTRRLVEMGLPDDYRIRVVNTRKDENQVLGELRRSLRIFLDLYHTLKNHEVDVIHLNTAVAGGGIAREAICLLIAKLFKKKVVLHCRCDVKEHIASMRFLWKPFASRLFKNVDSIINLNKASHIFIRSTYHRESEFVPNFIDNGFYDGLQLIENVSPIVKNILFVGMIIQWKGAGVVIEAARRLPDLTFHLVGRDVDVLSKIELIPSNITLHGELPYAEVKRMMTEADLFLFPSFREGFPNAVMEAMAVGLPIVATDAGAIPDMIGQEGGIIVKQGDVEEVVAAIQMLVHDSNKRQQMSNYNKMKVRNDYMYDAVTRKYTAIYNKTLIS
ncbi:glycosyltransferase family 4 protein [Dehalobacter sp.]|uniref:glycosyltransferase family 4 protein n=1 Tax=Dehalobacter sp. TaxID=1962289 RepID=UPI0025870BFC|nr:glycosyltransferase family 4 protein [Dehalobacter sp.]MDJ0304954.1 glycosyltransferase family 4 protein [Dehalobacter sp.]